MPSHIYIRTGDYHKGTLANIKAIKVDSTYVTACHAQGAYPLAYFPHNQHFMAATATLEGNSRLALYASDEVAKNANFQLMKEPGWGTIQHYYTIPYYVYVKFAKWDEILEMNNKVPELDYPSAMLHYARGMAYSGKGKAEKAKNELEALSLIATNEKLKEVTIWDINSVYELVQIGEKVLRSEILAKEKKYPQSIALLKEAIEIEDNLNYNEPPDWFFSVRHNLGAVQLKAGNYEDAIVTYQNDLQRLPKNGWALKGLSIAYTNLRDLTKIKEMEERFVQAWATADVELKSSIIQ
jgi:tetratricopeptide (TPR) repeat protein